MFTSAQDLLTIAAQILLSASVALYGYLFIQGLVNRSYKPVKPAKVAQHTIDKATTSPVPATSAQVEAIELTTTSVEVLPMQTESALQPAVAQQHQAIVLATAPGAIVPTRIQPAAPSPQAAAVTLAARLGVSLPALVAPPTGAIVLANHFATVFAATLTQKPLHPDYTSMSDLDLITAAKAAQFPAAKKWARSRKLRSGEKQRAIQFLQQQHQAIASRYGARAAGTPIAPCCGGA